MNLDLDSTATALFPIAYGRYVLKSSKCFHVEVESTGNRRLSSILKKYQFFWFISNQILKSI